MRAAALAAACSAVVLSSCAVGPDFHEPQTPSTEHYTPEPEPAATVEAPGPAGAVQTLVADRDIPAEWWTLFRSEPLDQLVREALKNSPSIAAAEAALRSAEQAYVAQRGALAWPAVDAQFAATRERVPGAAFGLPGVPASVFTLYDASINVSYRLDLFGATRRELESLRAGTEYQQWELEAANLTLAGNVVTTAVNAASLRAQIAAASDILVSEREQLRVVERQFAAGGVSQADVLSQRAQVSQTEASIPGLENALAQAHHRLSVLAGRTPDSASGKRITA